MKGGHSNRTLHKGNPLRASSQTHPTRHALQVQLDNATRDLVTGGGRCCPGRHPPEERTLKVNCRIRELILDTILKIDDKGNNWVDATRTHALNAFRQGAPYTKQQLENLRHEVINEMRSLQLNCIADDVVDEGQCFYLNLLAAMEKRSL